jgi:hypothetical protein
MLGPEALASGSAIVLSPSPEPTILAANIA